MVVAAAGPVVAAAVSAIPIPALRERSRPIRAQETVAWVVPGTPQESATPVRLLPSQRRVRSVLAAAVVVEEAAGEAVSERAVPAARVATAATARTASSSSNTLWACNMTTNEAPTEE
jgi:hypothetical protein